VDIHVLPAEDAKRTPAGVLDNVADNLDVLCLIVGARQVEAGPPADQNSVGPNIVNVVIGDEDIARPSFRKQSG
jgi:hypothetical protein